MSVHRCAVLYCRRPGVVRVLMDADWPFHANDPVIVRYFLCLKHGDSVIDR